MSLKINIGIDPGSSSGGMALIVNYEGSEEIMLHEFKKMTEKDIVDKLRYITSIKHENGCDVFAYLESVHSFPKQGISSAFVFGQNFGFLKGALTSLLIPYELITPQSWIKQFGMKKDKDESKGEWKRRLREKAEMLYPKLKITANTADALLIAHVCKINNFK